MDPPHGSAAGRELTRSLRTATSLRMPQSSRVSVALIGCGRIAHVHQQYLAEVPEVEVVAVCDRDPAARALMSGRALAPAYAEVDEMLRCAAPQVVHILTPPSTHASLALLALDAGAHVFVEKPLALSAAEADSILRAAQRRGRIVTADHNRWFDPVVRRARALVDSDALGDLTGVEIFQGALAEGDLQGWKSNLPGGPIHDVAPHPLYFLRHFVGPIERCEILTERNDEGHVVEARLIAQGARTWGTVTVSMRTRPAANWVRLFGSQATAEINLNHMTLVLYREHQGSKLAGKVRPNLEVAWQLVRETVHNGIDFVRGRQRFYPGMGAHIREFYRCLTQGLPPPIGAAEARDVVALCEQLVAVPADAPRVRAVGT